MIGSVFVGPTATPLSAAERGPVVGSALFYGLLLLGIILFLAAFFYGRRRGL